MNLISLEKARELLLAGIEPLAAEAAMLDQALGRTLAEAVVASHDQPDRPRSMMDGIAVADHALMAGASLNLIGESRAGLVFDGTLQSGQAVRIATGAVVPDAARQVIPQEEVSFDGDRAVLRADAGPSLFIRSAGSDFRQGETLLCGGTILGPAEVGLAAAANRGSLSVRRRPRIAILSSGDELVAAGSLLTEGGAIDSAGPAIAALAERWGADAHRLPIVGDDPDAIRAVLSTALGAYDLLLCIGGASVGARDYLRPVVADLGGRFAFEKIAVQPGKPCWHARVGDSGMVLGLPGNPSSAYVCAHLLLEPLLAVMLGRDSLVRLEVAIAAAPFPANGAREQYVRATMRIDSDGRRLLEALPSQDSGLQAALARADALVRRIPHAPSVDTGARVAFIPLH